jgi:hypothetical protein
VITVRSNLGPASARGGEEHIDRPRQVVPVEELGLLVELVQFGRVGHRHEADEGAGLVDEVEGLEW